MIIIVNDIAASCGGAMTVLKQFYRYIREHDTENEWIFLLGDSYLEENERIKVITLPEVKASHVRKLLFDLMTGRKFIEALHPDAVLSLQNILTFGVRCPQYVYIHQSIPFQSEKNFSLLKKEERSTALIQYGIGSLIKESARKADGVIVQTEWMKAAVAEKARIPKEKIITAFPEVRAFSPAPERFSSKSFFYPTNSSPYKNLSLLLKACDLLNTEGITDFEVLLTLPEGAIDRPNIRCVGSLNETEMEEQYQSSTLVFPSYIETVGLPLLEARSCGSPILASDTPFSRECLRGYENASFFYRDDAAELARLMKEACFGQRRPLFSLSCLPSSRNGWEALLSFLMKSHPNNKERNG